MRIKKILGRTVLAAFGLYVLWLGWQIARFKRYESPISTTAQAALTAPPLYEFSGVYHIHSRYSDGWKTVDKIAETAAGAGLDFIILTDHGKPNYASLDAQGWNHGLLVLAGSELSTNRGHMVALGFDRPKNSTAFSQDAEVAVREIVALGGFAIIAHPYSKVRWSWGDLFEYAGIEIIDADSMLKRHPVRSLSYLPALLIKPGFALLKMIDPPEQALRKWDQLLSRRPALGFFSADAHLLYGAIFPVFHLHVLLDKPRSADFETARRQVFDSLRRGSFYSAVDAAADARGFRFWLEAGSLRAIAPFSFAHETVIIHDGKMIHRTRENEVTLPLSGPGVYRAEVYLRERTPLAPGVPWILSNPIYFGRENP